MFGPLGAPEIIFIIVLALLIFGPRRLPEMGRTVGKALGEFRRATTELKRSINTEIALEDDADRPRYSRTGRDGEGEGAGTPARRPVENRDDEFVVTTEGLISPREAGAAGRTTPAGEEARGGVAGEDGAAGPAEGAGTGGGDAAEAPAGKGPSGGAEAGSETDRREAARAPGTPASGESAPASTPGASTSGSGEPQPGTVPRSDPRRSTAAGRSEVRDGKGSGEAAGGTAEKPSGAADAEGGSRGAGPEAAETDGETDRSPRDES